MCKVWNTAFINLVHTVPVNEAWYSLCDGFFFFFFLRANIWIPFLFPEYLNFMAKNLRRIKQWTMNSTHIHTELLYNLFQGLLASSAF